MKIEFPVMLTRWLSQPDVVAAPEYLKFYGILFFSEEKHNAETWWNKIQPLWPAGIQSSAVHLNI